jgi:hypothetical protein
MKKWHIILGVFLVVLVIAIFFFVRSSNIYSAQVVAVEAGSSIGMAPFTDRVDFGDVPLGVNVSKTIILENNGNNDNTIKLYILGSISQLIKPQQGYSFEIKAGQSVNLVLQLTMPASAPVGKKFSGRIIILRLP